jgi:uncharacterized small protein (DUF1192 family)
VANDAEDLEPRAKREQSLLPADLSRHSLAELEGLIAVLEGEIRRCREAIAAKRSTRDAAEGIFKR